MTDRDRLIKLICKVECEGKESFLNCPERRNGNCRSIMKLEMCQVSAIADFVLADGWIRPPCKVGTEIFGVFDNDDEQRKEIYDGKVLCYSLDENNLLWARMRYKNGLTYWHTIDHFGKTVFLSKEEA